ncbi:hypothetical protein D3C87_2159360 [compost metagenome]
MKEPLAALMDAPAATFLVASVIHGDTLDAVPFCRTKFWLTAEVPLLIATMTTLLSPLYAEV